MCIVFWELRFDSFVANWSYSRWTRNCNRRVMARVLTSYTGAENCERNQTASTEVWFGSRGIFSSSESRSPLKEKKLFRLFFLDLVPEMHNLESGLDGVSLALQQTRTFWILNDNYDVMFEARESVCWRTSIVLVTVSRTTFLAAANVSQ